MDLLKKSVSVTKLPIGLLGGTFDPFHFGHLGLCLSLYAVLPLQEIQLIPSAQPLLRNPPLATPGQRLNMLQAVCQDSAWLTVNPLEIQRGGASRTIETLALLRKSLPKTPLGFIMSMDQFMQFDQWYEWEQIPELAHLIVANRPDYPFAPNPALKAFLKDRQIYEPELLSTTLAGGVLFQAVPPLAISATEIRAILKTGGRVEGSVPDAVLNYILQNKLYFSGKG